MAAPLMLKFRLARKILLIAILFAIAVITLVVALLMALLGAATGKAPPANGAAGGALPCSAATGGELRGDEVPDEYEEALKAAATASGISAPILAAQIYKESSWNPNAYNAKAGAAGLAQFIPSTWATWGQGDPYDPQAAIKAQGAYMGALLQEMKQLAAEGAVTVGVDPVQLALAGYNAGPGNVRKFGGIPPFEETQRYVPTILELAQTKFGGGCLPSGSGVWTHPLPGSILTSTYGPRWGDFHAGLDLATSGGPGTVVAAADMQVTYAACGDDGYGCAVVGIAPDGLQFRYGHMARGSLQVEVGQSVAVGTPLGTEGDTGYVTGVHLHFEVYAAGAPANAYASSGKSMDPLPILQEKGIQV